MDMKSLGKDCKRWRQESCYTQSYIANLANKSVESVSAFENGRVDSASLLILYMALGYDSTPYVDGWKRGYNGK